MAYACKCGANCVTYSFHLEHFFDALKTERLRIILAGNLPVDVRPGEGETSSSGIT